MNIVYQDITKSDISFEVNDVKFYFSSSFNLDRFKRRYEDYISNEENKIINRYHYPIELKKYFLICFYKLIEKRGFLIEINQEKLTQDELQIETKYKMECR